MRIRISRSIVPNLFTVLNIFFGFLCIVVSVQGKYTIAGWYIVCSAVCDTLDGLMARLTKSSSAFGVELDSLADIVSFGVAPSFLFYQLVLRGYGPAGTLVAASQLVFGALRLARFNAQLTGFHKDHFTGLPIPLSALTLVSFLFYFTPGQIALNTDLQHLLIAMIIGFGLLMVSTVRYPVLPRLSVRMFREHPVQGTFIAAAAIGIAVTLGRALFPVLLFIVLAGLILSWYRSLARIFRHKGGPMEDAAEERSPSPADSHT